MCECDSPSTTYTFLRVCSSQCRTTAAVIFISACWCILFIAKFKGLSTQHMHDCPQQHPAISAISLVLAQRVLAQHSLGRTSRELALYALECIELPFYEIALCLFILQQHSTKNISSRSIAFGAPIYFCARRFHCDALTDVELNDSFARTSYCQHMENLHTPADIEYV